MKMTQLGSSDLEISRIGIGAWAMGGPWEWGWGTQDDQDSIDTIHHALARGINWIDTAPVYGLGHSESVVGTALKQCDEQPLIFTKCGFRWNSQRDVTPSLTAASVREEVEASLRRLQVERIDLYQIHWPNPVEEIEQAWQAMSEMQQEGKLRHIAVSNHNVEQLQRLGAIAPVTSVQSPYNLCNREIEAEVLPYCQESNTGVLVYSPMASGLLSGSMTRERIANLAEDDWRRKNDEFNEPNLSRNLARVDKLREIALHHGVTVAEVAIAWTLHHPGVSAAIVGMRTPAQVAGLIRASEVSLSASELRQIEAI